MDDHTRDQSVEPPPAGQSPSGWLPAEDRWVHDTLRRAVVHGVRLFNSGEYHDSHDCFEDEWFNYGHGTVERDFLQGMVQVAAGAYKYVDHESEEGLRRLLETARGYLDEVPDDFYGVDVAAVRQDIEAVLAEPSTVEDVLIELDGEYPQARDTDLEYAAALP